MLSYQRIVFVLLLVYRCVALPYGNHDHHLNAALHDRNTGDGGFTYTRWGKYDCEKTGATLLYKGFMAGAHHLYFGAGSNYLCLPDVPEWDPTLNFPGYYSGHLFGTEYRLWKPDHSDALDKNPTPCAVCYVAQRSTPLMIPAKVTCPQGWVTEYSGYLASEGSSWQKDLDFPYVRYATSYICMDKNSDVGTGSVGKDQSLVYPVKVGCGTLPCSIYSTDRDLACVVCSR